MSTDDYIFSRDAIREVDRRAIEDYGIPGIVLMENAARGAADHILRELERIDPDKRTVLLVAGGGNNGGDAFAIARHLHNAGVPTRTVSLKPTDSYTGDAATNLAILDAMDLPHYRAGDDPLGKLEQVFEDTSTGAIGLVVDAVLGTGITGEVRAAEASIISWMNILPAAIVSIDVPSGLDCDTGEELGVTVKPDLTITFAGYKRGFVTHAGKQVVGRIEVVDIGVPRELMADLADPSVDS